MTDHTTGGAPYCHAARHAPTQGDPIRIIGPEPYAGVLHLGRGFSVSLYDKPRLFHRMMMRLFFGWRWEDKP